jgi:signal transduction histidine kinase
MSHSATQTERTRPFSSSTAILRSLAEGVLIVDTDGYVRQMNPAAGQLLALDPATVLDREFEFLPFAGALGQQPAGEQVLLQLGERLIGVEKRPLLAEEEDQPALGTLYILHERTSDLGERQRQYDYLCRALHDVRVPLQAISGASEGLMRGWFGPLNDEQHEFAGIIKENADHQGELINQIYDAYALAGHFAKLNPEQFSIASAIHKAEQEFAARFAERQLSFSVDRTDDLPPIVADRQRVRQMLGVLLGNALRYTHPGGTVALRAWLADRLVVVEIQDTGVGIRAVDQPKIFTPFFRGENPLKEGRYGGLSLVIAKLLAEQHGGWLQFASAEGQGSTFSFALPIA